MQSFKSGDKIISKIVKKNLQTHLLFIMSYLYNLRMKFELSFGLKDGNMLKLLHRYKIRNGNENGTKNYARKI